MAESKEEVIKDEVKEEIKDIAVDFKSDDLEFETEIDGEVAKVTLKDKDFYEKKANENGISRESLERAQTFDELYLSTMVKASGKKSEEIFKDNDKIKIVDVEGPFGPHFEAKNNKMGIREAKRQSATITTHIVKERSNSFTDDLRPSVRVIVESPKYALMKKDIRAIEDEIKNNVYTN